MRALKLLVLDGSSYGYRALKQHRPCCYHPVAHTHTLTHTGTHSHTGNYCVMFGFSNELTLSICISRISYFQFEFINSQLLEIKSIFPGKSDVNITIF